MLRLEMRMIVWIVSKMWNMVHFLCMFAKWMMRIMEFFQTVWLFFFFFHLMPLLDALNLMSSPRLTDMLPQLSI